MTQYLKEMGIEDINDFASSQEFERRYFGSLMKKAHAPDQSKNPALNYNPDEIKFLNKAVFAKEPAFKKETLDIEVNADSLQIIKIGEDPFLNKSSTALVAASTTLLQIVPDEFHAKLKMQITSLRGGKNESLGGVAFKFDNGEIRLLEIAGTMTADKFSLSLTDKTQDVAKIIGKDVPSADSTESTSKPIDLIIFRYTCLKTKEIKRWVTQTASLLSKLKLWPAGNRPKFIALRYEEDPNEKAAFNHPFIDDLVVLPIDRLIFLQKVELALGLPKKVSPSFLFVQPVVDYVEIAKRVMVEKINDVGFVISNPIPLAPGTSGQVYFRFPNQKPLLNFAGKVYKSLPHPEIEGLFHIYFNYFALSKNNNKELKSYLSKDQSYKSLINQDANQFAFNGDNIFLTEEEKRKKTIAILDVDDSAANNIADHLKKEIHNIEIAQDNTYYGFLKKHIQIPTNADIAPPATAADFYANMVSILISANEMNLQMALTPPSDEDRFLGHEIKKLFSDQQSWLTLFDGDARNLLTECLYLVASAKRIQKDFEIKHTNGERKSIAIEFILEPQDNTVRLNFKLTDSKVARTKIKRLESLECVIVDYALLPKDFNAFRNSLKEACEKSGIRVPEDGPRIIVTAAEGQIFDIAKILESNVHTVIYKPLEIRRLLCLVAQAIDSQYTIYTQENIGWRPEYIAAKISKSAFLVELSEFGATIKTKQPLKPGTMGYLFKSVFTNAPDQNICARVYHSEVDAADENSYLNSVIYFGISDAFLKYLRAHIREAYAQTKAKESAQQS